jgi:O-acetyl-ADP-ribose deacetylase (regulator of RNase III)
MISYIAGDLFESRAQVLTNTVNCVGVMGKGLALEFKKRYPALFRDYAERCARGEMKIGEPWLWEGAEVQILNFPTKRHWRAPSLIEDIDEGLKWLAARYGDVGISTIAMPALGCGNGGLPWNMVRPLMEARLGTLPDLEVFVYPVRSGGAASTGTNGTRGETRGLDRGDVAASPASEGTLFEEASEPRL